MKVELTQEQYNKLNTKEYRWFLSTAYKSKFITGMKPKQAKFMFDMYNEVFHENKKTTGCSQCKLEVCTRLGRLFFEYEENMYKELAEEDDMTEEELEEWADETNKALIKAIQEEHRHNGTNYDRTH